MENGYLINNTMTTERCSINNSLKSIWQEAYSPPRYCQYNRASMRQARCVSDIFRGTTMKYSSARLAGYLFGILSSGGPLRRTAGYRLRASPSPLHCDPLAIGNPNMGSLPPEQSKRF